MLPGLDIFHSSFIAIILSLGLVVIFFTQPHLYMPKSAVTWIALLLLVLIQPLINTIHYPDALIFPLGNLLLCLLLSISVASFQNNISLIKPFLCTLIICMVLSTVIQLLQFNHIIIHKGHFLLTEMQGRFDGNFFQPNQLAFMFVLAQVALLYFYYQQKHTNLKDNKKYVLISLLLLFMVFSFSIGLTMSRGGLIMAIAAIIGYGIFFNQPIKTRLAHTALLLIAFAVSYYAAIWCYETIYLTNYPDTTGSLTRVESISIRGSLQQRAWELFVNHPLTGVGWHNYSYNSINSASDIKWFTYSEHSHFLFSQIASELGILGLLAILPITWLIVKKISFRKDNFDTFLYVSLGIFLLYSFSEFPLWYLRFLYIFVIYVTILDKNRWEINTNFNKIFAFLSAITLVLSTFYMLSFIKLYKVAEKFEDPTTTEIQKLELFQAWQAPFGYSNFKELLMFNLIPVDHTDLKKKINIGDRVLTVGLSKYLLFKQGQLLALDGQQEPALAKFKAACALEWTGNCDDITSALKEASDQDPSAYSQIFNHYKIWVIDFDPSKNPM